MLTALDTTLDKLLGFEADADDYLIDLTAREFALLDYLMPNAGRVVSK